LNQTLNIKIENQPQLTDVEIIRKGLTEFNNSFVEIDNHERMTVFLRSGDSTIVGGLIGGTYWHWLYIEILWLQASLRGKGYGKSLLLSAEQEAINRGCRFAHLDSHDFQSVTFYEHLGYKKSGELKDLPIGHSRFLMWKQLI